VKAEKFLGSTPSPGNLLKIKHVTTWVSFSRQNFIVDKTEKYSTLLAESLAESTSLKTTPAGSDSELGPGNVDDDDYEPDQVNTKLCCKIISLFKKISNLFLQSGLVVSSPPAELRVVRSNPARL
jgi:hypothetical protein